ncbi:MAG TPA: SDR family NAD(P)-dependent oxidoreductase [Pseudomonadales bacterium]|nr:SDR family NAD(P)-dependent oxidoreductase [Pseudomonadales bacterium]
MAGRLEGRIALVVGAGQTPGEAIGNGRATALAFAAEGARVLAADRDRERAEATVALIREAGGEAEAMGADASREADCEAMVAAAVERWGRLDILQNNVGIGAGDTGPAHMTEAVWDRIQDVNVKSVVFTCKHAIPVMRGQASGVITNISSVAAVCSVGIVAYKASKAAINAYTQSLAIGNARHGIRANVIMPGLMNTPMAIEGYVAAGRDREELIRQRDDLVPLAGGMGSGWDVAWASVFLASDEARFITGVNLPVDGGQSARVG